jgi:sulfite exporter TauE/SafE
MSEFSFLSAFLVGLLGAVHCAGMCGGVVTALSFSTAPASATRMRSFLLAYNLGRISSYTLAGFLAGSVGWLLLQSQVLLPIADVLQVLAVGLLLAMGLWLSDVWRGLSHLEALGARLWRRLEPLARPWLPLRSMPKAYMAGLLWGWLPCGLVYSVLVWALSTGSPQQGAGLLLAFGLGTLPNLLLLGWLAQRFQQHLRAGLQHPWVRRSAGGLVFALGLYQAWLYWG